VRRLAVRAHHCAKAFDELARRLARRTAVERRLRVVLDRELQRAREIVAELGWKEPWFVTSALSREGTWPIMLRAQQFFDEGKREAAEAAEDAAERARMAGDV